MILNNVTILRNGKLVKTDVQFEDKINYFKDNLPKSEECNGLFLMPGLRNAHVHLASRAVAGSAISLGKYEYFNAIGFKIHKKRRNSDIYNASLLACIESLKLGVTHVDTMDMKPEIVIKAINKLGLNYTACLAVKDNHTEAGDVKEQLNRSIKLNMLGLANEYECSPQLIRNGLDFAKEHDLPIHMHACETSMEVEHFKKLTGKRTIDYLNDIGLLDYDVRLAHCTLANSKELLLLSEHDVPVLHCPTCNMAISNTTPDVKLMLRNGVKVWVGTDSFAWNPNPSVLKEAMNSHDYTGVSVIEAYGMTHEPLIAGCDASFSLIDMSALKPYNSMNEFLAKLMLLLPIKKVFLKGRLVVNEGVINGFNEKKLKNKVMKIRRRLIK